VIHRCRKRELLRTSRRRDVVGCRPALVGRWQLFNVESPATDFVARDLRIVVLQQDVFHPAGIGDEVLLFSGLFGREAPGQRKSSQKEHTVKTLFNRFATTASAS